MAKPKPRGSRRILRKVGIALGGLVLFLLLFVAAFVFNPFEGAAGELRDVVPRGVNFFVRKQRLADDFAEFPKPRFWDGLAELRGFAALADGELGKAWERAGVTRLCEQAAAEVARVRADSGGFLDVLRDLVGDELLVAGYEQDYSQQPPRPLAEPQWCAYMRVTWRVKAIAGLARFGFVQSQMRQAGVDCAGDGPDLVVKLPGAAAPLRVRRHLDLLMVGNDKALFEQSQRLIDGNRDEEPVGRMAAYTDGAEKRIERWADVNDAAPANVAEFVVEPNAFDGFRRFAASWPDPQAKDSMNERVLAAFLNLRGWQQISGGAMFADGAVCATGQIGLNSRQHTTFQSSFYKAEVEPREKWLDPFLAMVPESACAAAALRMPAGEFLNAMFDALDEKERQLFDEMVARTSFLGQNVPNVRELIERIRPALLPRTGFVFRQNDPVTEREDNGELKIPVAARSPVPQVAWVFWLQPNGKPIADEVVTLLRTYASTFGFRKQWLLSVPFGGGKLPEPVNEFTNPQIPGTGELAVIVFREFFVLSNSGPLICDILRARYPSLTGSRSIRDLPGFAAAERELPKDLNGFVWLHGGNMQPLLDDYLAFAEADSEQADPEWMMQNRPNAEDQVRRQRFPQYASKASMPKKMTEPGGDFDAEVVAWLREQWRKERANFTAEGRARLRTFRAVAGLLDSAYLQLELENGAIRFQARVATSER
ncbi:MAG: hypothetical protein ACK5BN_00635 [Planctomycetota bacterium]